jgi:asparaginyl-tRNA synthetase
MFKVGCHWQPSYSERWVRTKRDSKNVAFIALNDGSVIHNLQIVFDKEKLDEAILSRINTGASLSIVGTLAASQGSGQKVELMADSVEVLGEADPMLILYSRKNTASNFYARLPTCARVPIHSVLFCVCVMP